MVETGIVHLGPTDAEKFTVWPINRSQPSPPRSDLGEVSGDRHLDEIVSRLETLSGMAVGRQGNPITGGMPGWRHLIEFALGETPRFVLAHGVDDPHLTAPVMKPTPTVISVGEPADSLRSPPALVVAQIFLAIDVGLGDDRQRFSIRTPGQVLHAESEISDLARLAAIDGHHPHLGHRFLEIGGSEEGEVPAVRCPPRHRIDRSGRVGRMVLTLVNMNLPAVCVLTQIEAANYKRHPIPVGMDLGIRRDGKEGEILRLHG
jgi:hypothetical protein